MSKILIINSHPGNINNSKTLQLLEEFKQNIDYTKHEVTINNLDITKMQDVDGDVLNAYAKLAQKTPFDELTITEKEKLNKRQRLLNEFMNHDIFIFATPMWELSFPASLKVYLDTICSVNNTFKYDPNTGQPMGLLENKKAICIMSSGGDYTKPYTKQKLQGEVQYRNFGNEQLESVLAFMGVEDYQFMYAHSQAIPEININIFNQVKENIVKIAKEI